jgi:hypothetical protein
MFIRDLEVSAVQISKCGREYMWKRYMNLMVKLILLWNMEMITCGCVHFGEVARWLIRVCEGWSKRVEEREST